MTIDFYNALAPYYKLLYPDWDASVARQAEMLHSVIQEHLGDRMKTLVDVACGIGTQSIGLSKLSYSVAASDISPGEIEQAKREAIRHKVEIRHPVDSPEDLFLYDNGIRVGRIKLVDKKENARTFRPKSVPSNLSFHKGRVKL